MPTPILATKLHIPALPSRAILRPRLIAQLNEGLSHKVTLISAAAGFGKTTLVSEWIAGCERPAAWLSLDASDGSPTHFLTYLVAALQTISAQIGAGVMGVLGAPQAPPVESILTALINDIANVETDFLLVLDDYHATDAKAVDQILGFLIEHLPGQMHLVIATREDPNLPLARVRAQGQLTELRAADLRFTAAEAAGFLNQGMGLRLSEDDIAALETRTEGWIAGLQLAAISMQGHPDASGFIRSFTGSHHFVLDFLVEEVLQHQSEAVQTFLLRTSLLDRLCGPLSDAMLQSPAGSGQAALENLEQANLFIVPLDNERHWYRYHHLFGELLRQRLGQHISASPEPGAGMAELHIRASQWFEDNDLDIEAFQHAAAANDVERAARLLEGDGMPLLFRGAVAPAMSWFAAQPKEVLDARPSLWVLNAAALLFVGDLGGVEAKVQAAEAALQGWPEDDYVRDTIGHIAVVRATLAVSRHDAEDILHQSRRALEYLDSNNLPVRIATLWTLGYAYQLRGDRAAARQAYSEAIPASAAIGHFIILVGSTLGLGMIQEVDTQLHIAAETYRKTITLAGNPPVSIACDAHLGLARIHYEWNDLDAADRALEQGTRLANQIQITDRFISCEVFNARIRLTRGDVSGAAAVLAAAEKTARQRGFANRMPEIAAAHVLILIAQGNVAAAADVARAHEIPLSRARVCLAEGNPRAAAEILAPFRAQMEARGWEDERLRAMILQAVALDELGERDAAIHVTGEAMMLAEPGGYLRIFLDEGDALGELIDAAADRGVMRDYARTLLAGFAAESSGMGSLAEPLSPRELEVLRLIAEGLSNQEISERLFLALITVKGHNQKIFGKLQVRRRTEAVARARELGLV